MPGFVVVVSCVFGTVPPDALSDGGPCFAPQHHKMIVNSALLLAHQQKHQGFEDHIRLRLG
jgi:hypothetical protein